MKFTLDNRFFFKFKNNEENSNRLWKELGDGKHIAYLPSTVLAEFFSTVYLEMTQSQRLRIENILKFSRVRKKDNTEIPILVNSSMPTLLLVDSCPSISIKAGELIRTYNMSLGDSYIAASHIKNSRSDFVLTDDPDFNCLKSSENINLKSISDVY